MCEALHCSLCPGLRCWGTACPADQTVCPVECFTPNLAQPRSVPLQHALPAIQRWCEARTSSSSFLVGLLAAPPGAEAPLARAAAGQMVQTLLHHFGLLHRPLDFQGAKCRALLTAWDRAQSRGPRGPLFRSPEAAASFAAWLSAQAEGPARVVL